MIFDVPARPPGGPEQAAAIRALAEGIAAEPDLLWTIWTESAEEKRAGGIHLFRSRTAAEACHAMHAARLTPVDIFPNCPRNIPRMQVVEPSPHVPRVEPAWKTHPIFADVVPPRKA